jgi:hypothetical protein
MRTLGTSLIGTSLIGISLLGVNLIAGPAMAQQHPWVPSCVYEGWCGFTASPPHAHARGYHSTDRRRAGNTGAAYPGK